jgi:hypothetical protein
MSTATGIRTRVSAVRGRLDVHERPPISQIAGETPERFDARIRKSAEDVRPEYVKTGSRNGSSIDKSRIARTPLLPITIVRRAAKPDDSEGSDRRRRSHRIQRAPFTEAIAAIFPACGLQTPVAQSHRAAATEARQGEGAVTASRPRPRQGDRDRERAHVYVDTVSDGFHAVPHGPSHFRRQHPLCGRVPALRVGGGGYARSVSCRVGREVRGSARFGTRPSSAADGVRRRGAVVRAS